MMTRRDIFLIFCLVLFYAFSVLYINVRDPGVFVSPALYDYGVAFDPHIQRSLRYVMFLCSKACIFRKKETKKKLIII